MGDGDIQRHSTCSVKSCGNGVVASTEARDDGDTEPGDGYEGCVVEAGFECTNALCGRSNCVWMTGNEICGDGFTLGAELDMDYFCDDGLIAAGDGCSANCTVECGYSCDGGLADAADTFTTACGNAVRTHNEACDDGNTKNGDGCSSSCRMGLQQHGLRTVTLQ